MYIELQGFPARDLKDVILDFPLTLWSRTSWVAEDYGKRVWDLRCRVCVYDSVCEKWRVSHCIWKEWNHDNGIGIGIVIDTDIDIGIFSSGEW